MAMRVSRFWFLICFCLLFMCACDPGPYEVDRESLEGVVSVEWIDYENPSQAHFDTWVFDQSRKLRPFDLSKATVQATLPTESIPAFLDAFEKTDILAKYYAFNSPNGRCIRLTYENGDFLIICINQEQGGFPGYIGEYRADGSVLSYWGCFSSPVYYENLVAQFFAFGKT